MVSPALKQTTTTMTRGTKHRGRRWRLFSLRPILGGILLLVSLSTLWIGYHLEDGTDANDTDIRRVNEHKSGSSFFMDSQHQITTATATAHMNTASRTTTSSPLESNAADTPVNHKYRNATVTGGSSPSSSDPPIKIAHVISLITCRKASTVKGFLDALFILRHSIHQNSVHNTASGSKYSYQMYAILHPDGGCLEHVDLLQHLGYIPLIRPTPVNISAITTNDWYRSHVEGENCCGSAEFVKLYAYTLTDHPVAVHWDLDVAVLKPLDDLYDVIIYDADSETGRAARARLQTQRQRQHPGTELPNRIDALFTRDVTSSTPWERVHAVQGGFVVSRPSLQTFQRYQDFIMEANYTPGRGNTSGWGGLGYGGFQGAMAYQGVLAYYYDIVDPGHSVELDVCRWNQVVADVIWRGPNRMEHEGQCRHYPETDGDFVNNRPELGQCEDCRVLPIEETSTVHYTACKKPWECEIPFPRVPNAKRKAHAYRLRELTNATTCGLLFRKYFDFRKDIEDRIATVTGTPPSQHNGGFYPEYFLGYCKRSNGYQAMDSLPDDFDMKQVYGF
jgi:hypothetical protein